MIIRLDVVPMGKPRMTQRDKWNKRPVVKRYYAYCNELKLKWPRDVVFPAAGAHIRFNLPMPKWANEKGKRRRMNGRGHQQTPDVDNLVKAFLDALHTNDAHIWSLSAEKRWAYEGSIIVRLPERCIKHSVHIQRHR